MAPPQWDEESEDSSSEEESVKGQTVAPVRRKFGDEEDSDDVADNWEEEEDSEAEREKAKKAAAAKAAAEAEAAKNKKPKSQRIEERREENRRRKAQLDDDETSSEDEDEADKRARLRKSEQDADLKNAQDLFANAGLGPKSRSAPNKALIIEDKAHPGQTIDLSTIPLFRPATKTQFDALSSTLVPLLTESSAKPHFALWAQNFVKSICAEMRSDDIKKVASGLTALSNEKMKEEKLADKGGKKTKAQKAKNTLSAGRDLGRGVADTTSYEDGLAEEDFM